MKRKTMKKKSYLFNSMLATALFAAALAASSCADNDLDKLNSEGDKGAAVSFDVKDVQEAVLADANPDSRAGGAASYHNQLREQGLTSADLEPQVLKAQTPAGMEACLVETTILGINPMQPDPQTRATVTKMPLTADFSTLGYRATSMTAVSSTPDWFYNARTKGNGELYNKLYWSWSENHFGRFYAVFPEVKNTYSKIKLSPATHAGNPYVDFEVDPDVANQKDLMTACSGVVEYQTQGVAPNTSLAFRHALTAVHFTVGQNLWAGRIDKIEISGAINKGTYTLSSDPAQPGTWALGTTTGTFTLSGININTAASPGSVITDDNGNYTFFMIPQQVTGKNIYVDIHFQDGKTIHVPLKGKWLPGTTKTYTLSNLNSNWQYHLEVLGQNNTAAYNATDAGTYTVRSYRQAGGVQLPVAWKIVSYQESTDGGAHFGPETQTAPDWLDNLSLTEGTGGTAAIQGTAKVKIEIESVDKLAARNAALKSATALGSAGSPYDLSTKGGSVSRSTANCYVISAPGHYRIPLVYGNAIKTGATNANAYISHAPTGTSNESYVLRNFKDHAGADITDPWIEKTNGGANNGVDGAEVVWADAADLVHSPSIAHVVGEGFLDFEVTAADIQSGNAVVAVTKGSGASKTVLWSWHLWFAPKDALDKIPVTNHQGVVYNFTKETLGWKPTLWGSSTYDKPRTVKVKVEQIVANNGTKMDAVINITQNPGSVKQGATTLYQWGRKDAFPGVDASDLAANSHFTEDADGDNISIMNSIQHPDFYYPWGHGYIWLANCGYYNLWSADNTVTGASNVGNDNPVVKTVYDPSPVGFKMPANNAFTGFTTTGLNSTSQSEMNVDGTSDLQTYQNNFGHNFWTNSSKTATIYFPASGARNGLNGSLIISGDYGCYWSAVPINISNQNGLNFNSGSVNPLIRVGRSPGWAARPVSE